MKCFSVRRAVGLIIAAAACLSPTSSLFAQSAPASGTDPDSLDTVVVTGRAGVGTLTRQEASYSITTLDEETLRRQAPTSVTEALKSVPGFWVEASGGEASGNVRARGIPVDGFGSINLLEDGVPISHDPALGFLNGDQVFRLDETIERIEVVRGGPSSIFYSNAPAGAVNFISRKVGDVASGLVKLTTGDDGLYRADFWYGAPLAEGWKLSLGGFYRYETGIRDPGYTGNQGGQLRATLAHEFDRGSVTLDLKHLDDSVFLNLGIPMARNASGDLRAVPGFDGNFGTLAGPETRLFSMKTADGRDYAFDNALGTKVERTQFTANFDYELAEGWRLVDQARYNSTTTTRNGAFPNAISNFAGLQTVLASARPTSTSPSVYALPAGATAYQLRYVTAPDQIFNTTNQNGNALIVQMGLRGLTLPVDEFMNDLKLSHRFDAGSGGTHDVTLGAYVARIRENFNRYSSVALTDVQNNARLLNVVAVGPTGNVVRTLTDGGILRYGYEWENATGEQTTTAFYLADEWQLNDALRIDAGVRWERLSTSGSWEQKKTVDSSSSLGTPAAYAITTGADLFTPFSDKNFDKLGWTIGADYQFSREQGMFARWTAANRLPSIGSFITNPTATPVIQTMDLGEVGYKYTARLFEGYATAFYTKYDNVGFTNNVFNATNTAVVQQQSLFANTRTYGLELEGTLRPTTWFDIAAVATLQKPEYRGLVYNDNVGNAPVLRNFNGNQLIRVPETSFRLMPGVNLLGERLRMQLAWEYVGKRYVDTANSVVLPAYDVLNFSASFKATDQLTLLGYVDNAFNSMGLTEGNPRAGELQSSDAGAVAFIARPVLGRLVRVAAMLRF